ncbi:MAG: polysaccharide deacetylase family protein, partial [Polyangiaceae bacterium]
IGGHGLHHVPLAECDAPTRDSEIAASTALLDRVGVRGPRVFAYPNGSHDQDAADAVQSAGFSLACTVQRGPWTPETLPMRIPRLFCRGDTPVPHRLLSGA